jgi:hypothetical protein
MAANVVENVKSPKSPSSERDAMACKKSLDLEESNSRMPELSLSTIPDDEKK